MPARTFTTRSEAQTRRLAGELAARLTGGEVIGLYGDFGAGKSVFVKGLAKGLGVKELVTSPSFILAQSFPGRLWLHHLDLYRLSTREAKRFLAVETYWRPDGVLCLEWADRLGESFPREGLRVKIEVVGEARQLVFEWETKGWAEKAGPADP